MHFKKYLNDIFKMAVPESGGGLFCESLTSQTSLKRQQQLRWNAIKTKQNRKRTDENQQIRRKEVLWKYFGKVLIAIAKRTGDAMTITSAVIQYLRWTIAPVSKPFLKEWKKQRMSWLDIFNTRNLKLSL